MRYRILNVEDDPHWNIVLAGLIATSARYDLACMATSLAEARTAIRHRRFDAALGDPGLPDGSEHNLLQTIVQHQPEMKAAVCTVYEDPESETRAIRAGALGYIIKSH